MSATTERKTAEERREAVLEAALTEFSARGLSAASTEAIARDAGISQPYLFRLFGTKKGLFVATAERCLSDTYARFEAASSGLKGEPALLAMGKAYKQMIAEDPRRLRAQMQSYAACEDAEICTVVRRGFGRIVELVESRGVPEEDVVGFFARGMLINVISQMGLWDADEPWAGRLVGELMKAK